MYGIEKERLRGRKKLLAGYSKLSHSLCYRFSPTELHLPQRAWIGFDSASDNNSSESVFYSETKSENSNGSPSPCVLGKNRSRRHEKGQDASSLSSHLSDSPKNHLVFGGRVKDKKRKLRIAVLTSGGDAPGMNAAVCCFIRCCFRNRSKNVEVYAVCNGFSGLLTDSVYKISRSRQSQICDIDTGGTILGTGRVSAFGTPEGQRTAVATLLKHRIYRLLVIGGNGSITGADILERNFHEVASKVCADTKRSQYEMQQRVLRIVTLPATIDNDVPCVCGGKETRIDDDEDRTDVGCSLMKKTSRTVATTEKGDNDNKETGFAGIKERILEITTVKQDDSYRRVVSSEEENPLSSAEKSKRPCGATASDTQTNGTGSWTKDFCPLPHAMNSVEHKAETYLEAFETLGADTALRTVSSAIDSLRTTIRSHSRALVVECMGRDCGWLALSAACATLVDYVLLPETSSSIEWRKELIETARAVRTPLIVLLCEGAYDSSGSLIRLRDVEEALEEALNGKAQKEQGMCAPEYISSKNEREVLEKGYECMQEQYGVLGRKGNIVNSASSSKTRTSNSMHVKAIATTNIIETSDDDKERTKNEGDGSNCSAVSLTDSDNVIGVESSSIAAGNGCSNNDLDSASKEGYDEESMYRNEIVTGSDTEQNGTDRKINGNTLRVVGGKGKYDSGNRGRMVVSSHNLVYNKDLKAVITESVTKSLETRAKKKVVVNETTRDSPVLNDALESYPKAEGRDPASLSLTEARLTSVPRNILGMEEGEPDCSKVSKLAKDSEETEGTSETHIKTKTRLKSVNEGREYSILRKKQERVDIRTLCLGHLQRGGPPSEMDQIRGQKAGFLAARCLTASRMKSSVSIEIHGTKTITVPLSSVCKAIRTSGAARSLDSRGAVFKKLFDHFKALRRAMVYKGSGQDGSGKRIRQLRIAVVCSRKEVRTENAFLYALAKECFARGHSLYGFQAEPNDDNGGGNRNCSRAKIRAPKTVTSRSPSEISVRMGQRDGGNAVHSGSEAYSSWETASSTTSKHASAVSGSVVKETDTREDDRGMKMPRGDARYQFKMVEKGCREKVHEILGTHRIFDDPFPLLSTPGAITALERVSWKSGSVLRSHTADFDGESLIREKRLDCLMMLCEERGGCCEPRKIQIIPLGQWEATFESTKAMIEPKERIVVWTIASTLLNELERENEVSHAAVKKNESINHH